MKYTKFEDMYYGYDADQLNLFNARISQGHVEVSASDLPKPEEVSGNEKEYKHFTSNEFKALLEPERVAIMIAKRDDVQIEIFYDEVNGADYVTFSDPKVEAGLSYLVSLNLLTEERKEEIVTLMTQERN